MILTSNTKTKQMPNPLLYYFFGHLVLLIPPYTQLILALWSEDMLMSNMKQGAKEGLGVQDKKNFLWDMFGKKGTYHKTS